MDFFQHKDFYYNIARFIKHPRDVLSFCLLNKLCYSIMKSKFLLLVQIREEQLKNPFESVIRNKVIWGITIRPSHYITVYMKRFQLRTLEISKYNKSHRIEQRSVVLKGKLRVITKWFNYELRHDIKKHPLAKTNRYL